MKSQYKSVQNGMTRNSVVVGRRPRPCRRQTMTTTAGTHRLTYTGIYFVLTVNRGGGLVWSIVRERSYFLRKTRRPRPCRRRTTTTTAPHAQDSPPASVVVGRRPRPCRRRTTTTTAPHVQDSPPAPVVVGRRPRPCRCRTTTTTATHAQDSPPAPVVVRRRPRDHDGGSPTADHGAP